MRQKEEGLSVFRLKELKPGLKLVGINDSSFRPSVSYKFVGHISPRNDDTAYVQRDMQGVSVVLIDVRLNFIQSDFITLVRRIFSPLAVLLEEGQVYRTLPTLVLHSESENDHEQTEQESEIDEAEDWNDDKSIASARLSGIHRIKEFAILYENWTVKKAIIDRSCR